MVDNRQRRLFDYDTTQVNGQAGAGQPVDPRSFGARETGTASLRNELIRKRSLILWELPHLGDNKFIEMYINPQGISFASKKEIERIRTKGGYITQYWGEDLDILSISGTTGDSGIEGINVLRDIYRSEQLALVNIIRNNFDKRRQSLMQLAASVVMWYQGQGYRGYFNDMSYNESADKPGLFDYQINFTVTEIIGRRTNFMQWHRRPWSTTDTPTEINTAIGETQATRGGGYQDGQKVGVLNIPPHSIQSVVITPTAAADLPQDSAKVVQIAVLRADPKDPTTKLLGLPTADSSISGARAQEINEAVRNSLQQQLDADLADQAERNAAVNNQNIVPDIGAGLDPGFDPTALA